MLKNRRGISLTTLIITIVVMAIIMGTLTYSAIDSVKIRQLNKLYNDLRQINDAVEIYYLQNGSLPIDTTQEDIVINKGDTREDLEDIEMDFLLKDGVNIVEDQNSFYNPNDYDINGTSNENATYQYLKLDLLDNLSLNYRNDDYIVNVKSHTIYNLRGVRVDETVYHTLLRTYIDTQYKGNHRVAQIRLREVPEMTRITSTTNEIYFAYSESSLNLKDYLIFDAAGVDELGDPIILEGMGEPKAVTFAMKDHINSSYFTLDESTGVLTRALYGEDIENTDDISDIVVTAFSYGTEDTQEITLRICMVSINVYDETVVPYQVVESINLAANRSESIYYNLKNSETKYKIQRNGVLNTQNPIILPTSKDYTIASAIYRQADREIEFNSGENYGSTEITFEVQSCGFPKDIVTVNVYDFEIYEENDDTNLLEINFTGTGTSEQKDFYLNVNGPEEINFDGIVDDVIWTELQYDDISGEFVEDTSGIIELKKYRSGEEINFQKVTITPKDLGTTYLKCQYKVAGEILGETILPINIKGTIKEYDETIEAENKYKIPLNDSISFEGNGDSAQLKYVFETIPSGTISYTASSSDLDFQFENGESTETNTLGEFVVTYTGTSSETTTEITITVVVENGGLIQSTYEDKIIINVSSS